MSDTYGEWMPLNDFCRQYDLRANTVQKRIFDDIWQRGVHYSSPEGGKSFLHEARCVSWLKENGKL